MAVPSYTTDLILFNDCTNATGWGEFTNMSLGAGPDTDTDLAIHGDTCITQDRAKAGLNSQGYDGNEVTLNTGDCFFVWTKFFAPNSLDTLANGGQRVVVGSSLSDWDAWSMAGGAEYPYGGWKNYVVDPTVAADFSNGTVTTYNACGNGWNLTAAPQKGNPFNTDIIRYGRGESIFTGGEASDYATFNGYSLVNDDPTDGRFGLIQAEGTGYLYKGLMSLGTSATAVDMRDSNTSLTIDDTTKVTTSFNAIVVYNASSNIEWTAIAIQALGTTSKGTFTVVDDLATVTKTSCTFTDMDRFWYGSNTTIASTIYRRCNFVSQLGAVITGCTFDAPNVTGGAVIASNLNTVSKCSFTSSGSGHAVSLPTVDTDTSLTWDNTDIGYTDASSGDETIVVSVNNEITLTINVATGASIPSIYNTGTGTVDVVSGQVTTLITVRDKLTKAVIQDAMVYVVADAGGGLSEGTVIINKVLTDSNGQVSDTRSLSSNQPIAGRARKSTGSPYYKTEPIGAEIDSSNGLTLTLYLILDE